MEDSDTQARTPMVLWLVAGALMLIGLFTVFGWVIGAMGTLIRLALLVLLVMVVLTVLRAAANRRG